MTKKNRTTLVKVATLADIKALLPAIYSPSSAEAMESTLDRVVRLTGSSSLSQVPADVVAWEEIAARIVWTGKFSAATPAKAKKDFDKFVARVSAIIRRAHQYAQPAAPVPMGVLAPWDAIAMYVGAHVGLTDADGKQLINSMSGVSLANLRARVGDVPPREVTTEVARNALIAAPADKRDSLRRSVRWFNNLIRTREMHAEIAALLPAASIGAMPIIRDAALDWASFGPGFLVSRDAAIEAAVRPESRREGADRFGGRLGRPALRGGGDGARRRRRRVENKTVSRKAHHASLSTLAEVDDGPPPMPKELAQRLAGTIGIANGREAVLDVPYLVKGLLVRGEVSVIYGPPNCGKSTLVTTIGMSVVRGEPFAGLRTRRVSRSVPRGSHRRMRPLAFSMPPFCQLA